jgi:hypothetical protein
VVHSPLYGDRTATGSEVIYGGNITLSFSNTLPTGNGSLSSITFKQGGVVKYTFTTLNISGAIITQGVYDITVVVTNPNLRTTYSCSLGSTCWYGCNNYTASSTLTFNYTGANLTTCTTLPLSLSPISCGTPP